MSDAPKPKFDPIKLEQLRVSQDYPMEDDEFQLLYSENAYCNMAHVNKRGYPVVTPMRLLQYGTRQQERLPGGDTDVLRDPK